MADRISGLDAVVTPLYTDVLPETQLAEVNVKSRKLSHLQLTQLINGNYLLVENTQTLPSPCPNFICYKFTTPGQAITLPTASGGNGHPPGKPIWFFPHDDNTENFDINTNDGSTYINDIGNNYFMLVYSTNANQNGTPINRILFADAASLGSAAYQNVSAFLSSAGGTLTGNTSIENTIDFPLQFSIYNSSDTSGAASEIYLTLEGDVADDATLTFNINGGDLIRMGMDNSDANAFVMSLSNSLGTNNVFRIGQDGVPTFPAAPLPVASGGTNAITAGAARTNLGAAASGANTDITSIALNNTGLTVKDTDASHALSIVPGSNLSANRVFTLTTGDAARTLDISAANVTVSALGALITALTTLTQNGVICGNNTSAPTATTAGTTGQLLIGSTGAAPAFGNSISADTTFTSSTSGATRTLLAQSTSNAASSGAIIEAQVAGSLAGDAVFKSTIVGGQTWTLGGDNSDSDAFVISANAALGTSNIMRASTSGAINFPLTPLAMAYLSATVLDVTGDNTTYNFTGGIFTEFFDQGNNFSNGTFTCPVSGKIRCNLNMILQSIAAGHDFLELALVTTNGTFIVYQCNPAAMRTKPGVVDSLGFPASILVPMVAGDTAYWTLTINNSTKTVDIVGGSSFYTTMSFKLEA